MSDDPAAKLDSKKVEQVKKFVNLAASANLAEAKNAAYKACQLIRQLGLDIVDPEEVNKVFVELAETQKQVKQLEAGAPAAKTLTVDSMTAAINRLNTPPSVPYRPPTSSADPFDPDDIFSRDLQAALRGVPTKPQYQSPPRPSNARNDPMMAPVTMQAQYDQQPCLYCKKVLRRGDQIRWQRGVGIWCPLPAECYKHWASGRQPAPFTGDIADLFKT